MKGRLGFVVFFFFLLLRRKQSAELVIRDLDRNGTGNCDRVQLGIYCQHLYNHMEEFLHTQGSACLSL